jgi:hypothetical protein
MLTKTSPWGEITSTTKMANGIQLVHTDETKGIRIAHNVAVENLSPAARAKGIQKDRYFYYEIGGDDCVALFELDSVRTAWFGLTQDELLPMLSIWHADYLINKGIEPEEQYFEKYIDIKTARFMKKVNHPDLIVSVEFDDNLPEGKMKLNTADDKSHVVDVESYKRMKQSAVMLLSQCK